MSIPVQGEMAGRAAALAKIPQDRAFDLAALLGDGTAGVEAAAWRRVEGAWHVAFKHDALALFAPMGEATLRI
jgi:hypothetical protein